MGFISKKSLEKLAAMFSQATYNAESNSDERALEVQVLYPDWFDLEEGTTLTVGQRVNYEDVLYNVIATHQKLATWNPADTPSLFAKVLIPDPTVIPEWEQPDSTNPYMMGDKVTHNGSTWESLVDYNTWEPGATGTETLWKEV